MSTSTSPSTIPAAAAENSPPAPSTPGRHLSSPPRLSKTRLRESFTLPKPIKPRKQRLTHLSTVENTSDLDTPEVERGWDEGGSSGSKNKPLDPRWRQVCASSVFPVIYEAPRNFDGTRRSLKEWVRQKTVMEEDWGVVGGGEGEGKGGW